MAQDRPKAQASRAFVRKLPCLGQLSVWGKLRLRQLPGWAVLADVAIGQLWKFRHVSDGAEQVVAAGCLADLFICWSEEHEAPARQSPACPAKLPGWPHFYRHS